MKSFVIALFICVSGFAQTLPQQLDSLLRETQNVSPETAISLGFIRKNQTHYFSYGTLQRNGSTKVNEQSLFEIASITKVLTSHAIAHAILEGKLKSGDFIDSFLLDGFILQKSLRNTIRISDLASHQSGLPDLDFRKLIQENSQQPVKQVTLGMLQSLVNNSDHLMDYGTYRYSTLGYALLGQILEKIYQQPYDQILQEKLFTPLKMDRSLTKNFEVKNKTTGYNSKGGEQEFFEWNVTAAAGLVKSNAVDMISFLRAILSQKGTFAQAARITEQSFYSKQGRELGLGINIIKDGDQTLYLKTGDSMGQSSIICYNLEHEWGLILLINQRNNSLRNQLFNSAYELIKKHQ